MTAGRRFTVEADRFQSAAARADPFLQPQKKKPAIVDRIWTNNQGTQVNARFVRVFGANVVVMRGARTLTLPFDSLSAADQDYVREVLVSRGEESLLPGAAAPVAENAEAGGAPAFAEPAPATIAPPMPPEPKDDGATVGRGNSGFSINSASAMNGCASSRPSTRLKRASEPPSKRSPQANRSRRRKNPPRPNRLAEVRRAMGRPAGPVASIPRSIPRKPAISAAP